MLRLPYTHTYNYIYIFKRAYSIQRSECSFGLSHREDASNEYVKKVQSTMYGRAVSNISISLYRFARPPPWKDTLRR